MKRWYVLADLCNRYGLKRYAEIGVKEGKNVGGLLFLVPGITVTAVDPWAAWSLDDPVDAEAKFDKLVRQYPDRVSKLKMIGTEAAKLFRDGEFDLVFIDDSHDYKTTKANIDSWLPKARSGGIISGHDYDHGFPGVDKAVRETFRGINTEPDSVWWIRV